jgi:hypothetical protein
MSLKQMPFEQGSLDKNVARTNAISIIAISIIAIREYATSAIAA